MTDNNKDADIDRSLVYEDGKHCKLFLELLKAKLLQLEIKLDIDMLQAKKIQLDESREFVLLLEELLPEALLPERKPEPPKPKRADDSPLTKQEYSDTAGLIRFLESKESFKLLRRIEHLLGTQIYTAHFDRDDTPRVQFIALGYFGFNRISDDEYAEIVRKSSCVWKVVWVPEVEKPTPVSNAQTLLKYTEIMRGFRKRSMLREDDRRLKEMDKKKQKIEEPQ